ncbi:hypothetical protein E3N88_24297 [Mikania micrantha]|uniref:Uncharacterized protein n=1 Tax=Mikania micrantha TaxID=192012 RepID=A0A5N6NFL3_9ASTR|nr:hypothetical protein E3N88_24297 [Mikania micrantha]
MKEVMGCVDTLDLLRFLDIYYCGHLGSTEASREAAYQLRKHSGSGNSRESSGKRIHLPETFRSKFPSPGSLPAYSTFTFTTSLSRIHAQASAISIVSSIDYIFIN